MRGSLGLQVASSADRPLIGRLATNLEVEIPKHINTWYLPEHHTTSLLFAQSTLELTLSYGNENSFAFARTPQFTTCPITLAVAWNSSGSRLSNNLYPLSI